jgi:hypothetical protein
MVWPLVKLTLCYCFSHSRTKTVGDATHALGQHGGECFLGLHLMFLTNFLPSGQRLL